MIKTVFFERKCFKFRFNCQTNPCQVPYIASDYQNYPFPVFLLKREVVTEAPEMRSVHFVKSMELTMDIMRKGNVIHCNTCQYVGWHELGLYPHL